MFFNYLTLFSALFISGVAIYYSVAGLAQIFAAAVIPVIIMGTALEVGKLVVAVWLHKNWRHAVWWLKWYLSVAVIVLMFITSMGIFGYLSKSHVEQAAADSESRAQTERIESSIARHEAIIDRAEQKIKGFETGGSTVDSSLQAQIDKELARIADARKQVQEQINQQIAIIDREDESLKSTLAPYKDQVFAINKVLEDLQNAITSGDIKKAQGIVGTRTDGQYGPATAEKVKVFREEQEAKIKELINEIYRIEQKPNPIKDQASKRLISLDASLQAEIDKSNKLIERLRLRVGQDDGNNNVEVLIAEQQEKIKASNLELDTLIEQKYALEAQVRKLEAEVGPIKYIAEFIYADKADKNLLEEAVRWVIVVIIFVFDPLAVLLLIASQYSFERAREEGKDVAMFEDVLAPNEIPPEPIMPENVFVNEYEINSSVKYTPTMDEIINEEIPEEHETINEDMDEPHDEESGRSTDMEQVEINDSVEEYLDDSVEFEFVPKHNHSGEPVYLNRVSEGYISFNGKTFQEQALLTSHPELELNLKAPVESGILYPTNPREGMLFFNLNKQPTTLERFNGKTWDIVDKNILAKTAYSDKYIEYLINAIATNEYNPELLNAMEKQRIEETLT